MDILRFITAGNVDDGKSTLIGRLLYDTKNIKEDVLMSVSDGQNLNLAYITDGLRSEREQGITIDVAYKFFTTKNRKFIITDAPGHFQYTRNLVTGASNADAMIIIIDAQNGITEQTKRHAQVASFLNIQHVVVAVNKMDVPGYDEKVFVDIQNEFAAIQEQLRLKEVTFIPMSALCGDNVSVASTNMGWYKGATLMQYLNTCAPAAAPEGDTRFTVQCAVKTDEGTGYAGKMLYGKLRAGERIVICPEGHITTVSKITQGYNEAAEANAGDNIIVFLTDGAQAKRGDIFALPGAIPTLAKSFDATICWLDEEMPLIINQEYILRINGATATCHVVEVLSKTSIDTLEQIIYDRAVAVNEFARVRIETNDTIAFDTFRALPANGRGILIDTATYYTCATFIIN